MISNLIKIEAAFQNIWKQLYINQNKLNEEEIHLTIYLNKSTIRKQNLKSVRGRGRTHHLRAAAKKAALHLMNLILQVLIHPLALARTHKSMKTKWKICQMWVSTSNRQYRSLDLMINLLILLIMANTPNLVLRNLKKKHNKKRKKASLFSTCKWSLLMVKI